MGGALKRPKLKKNASAASVLTVDDEDSDSDETTKGQKQIPVAVPVPSTPISVRLSIKDHTPLENVELLKMVNPSVNEKEFRSNLNTIRTLYDWENIPLDFFVDGYVGGEKTRRSLTTRSLSRSRAMSESRIDAGAAPLYAPPALPPRKPRAGSVTGGDTRPTSVHSAIDQRPGSSTPSRPPRPDVQQFQQQTVFDVTGPPQQGRGRSKTIASSSIKREVKPSDIVTLDTMYTRPAEEFWHNNPVIAGNGSHNPPPSPIVTHRHELSPAETKTYDLYVRKSLVVGPDGQPIRRSVAESRRKSVSQQPQLPIMIEMPIATPTRPAAQARRSVTNYSDARPRERSNSPEV